MANIHAIQLGELSNIGKGYPLLSGLKIPVTDNLVGAFLFGSGTEMSLKNYAASDYATVEGGSATDGEGYISLPTNVYVDTGVPETLAFTWLIVTRSGDVAVSTGHMGTWLTGGNGTGLYITGGDVNKMTSSVEKTSGQSIVSVNTDDEAEFSLFSYRCAETGAATLVNHTNDDDAIAANTDDREIGAARTIRIGGLYSASGGNGPVDVALALAYDASLTDLQLDDLAAWARAYLDGFDITV